MIECNRVYRDVIRMIQVTKTEEESRTLITIDGELSSESVAAVDVSYRQAERDRKPVHLYLRDVTIVDKSGIALLRQLAANGVHLRARGVYTSYLIDAIVTGDVTGRLPTD